MNKKYLKYLITLSLSIILTIITISTTNNNIFAILPQNSNTGMVNIELKLYSSDNEEIFINNGDIEIYNVKDLTIDDKTGEYMLDENTSETNYLFYGNKIILPTNIYPSENINKLFNKKNTSYNININDLNTYSLAITSPKSIFSLKDYEDNIQLTEHIANQEVSLTNYSMIKDREIDIRLDEFYIIINNEELKNCILKFNFRQQEDISSITYRFNQIINITYTLQSDNNSLLIQNDSENNTPNVYNVEEQISSPSLISNIARTNRTIKNYSNTGVFCLPVTQYMQKETTIDNKTVYSLSNGTIIRSITDEGTTEKIGNNCLKITYTDDFYVLYENIIPSVYNNKEINSGEIIGIVEPNKELKISYVYNKENILCDWMFDIYPEPLEGPAMSLMLQTDPSWKENAYGTSTIGKGGCGPSSFSMILSYYKNEIWTPGKLVSYMKDMGNGSHSWCHATGQGSYHSIFFTLSEEFGLNCEQINISEKTFKQELADGKFIIICIAQGPIYKGDGHFIVLRGITDDGYFLVNDPYNCFKLNNKYTYEDFGVITAAKTIFN